MCEISWIFFAWASILVLWTYFIIMETRDALELTRIAKRVAKDNLKLLSSRNELRKVSLIMTNGDVRTFPARGYKHEGGYFALYDKDRNLLLKVSDKDVQEVYMTRETEYTYLDPYMSINGYYTTSPSDNFEELKDERSDE